MRLRSKLVLLFSVFLVFSVYAATDSEQEFSQKLIKAPHKNVGSNVIDGTGTERSFSFKDSNDGVGENKGGNSKVSVSTVALFTLAMAAATGLGAVPFFFVELDPKWAGLCNGMAAGVMLSASFGLIREGQEHGAGGVAIGILAGGIFIWLCKQFLEQHGEVSMLDIKGADAAKVVLVIGIMTLHSFGEGSGVGVSFAGSKGFSQGLLVTLAIAVHNIPEGLAVSMVLSSRGVSPQNAMLWSVITSLPQPIVAVPAFMCADAFSKLLPFCTGFAAGCMIWMVVAEVIPDALEEAPSSPVGLAALISVHFKMQRLRVLGCVIAAASYCCVVLLVTAQTTDPSEVKALLAVKSRLIDPHNYLRNWNKGDPCISNWNKVFCSNETGSDGYLHITELQLLKMNLSGNLAPELGQLSHLWIIDFMWNRLTGTIPKEIGKISSLKLLLLNGNKLSGSLPEELGYLSNLDRLQVDENQMSGSIPKSFANLVRVKHLHMNNNSFSGQIPSELSQLPIIRHLLLDSNNLSGHLPPELSNLTEMRILQLDNNNFRSEIPASFGNLSRLVKLSLRNCSLQGFVPDLSKIANLTYLDLSRNHLIGPIPSQKLSDNMTTIVLSYNNLNGSIPRTFLDLPYLQKVDLRNNSLSDILGDLDPPANVSLWLENNPICTNTRRQNISQFCRLSADKNEIAGNSRDPNATGCQIPSCPLDDFYEIVPNSTVYCFCAAPIRIGYRLKSPSFSYFGPYYNDFKVYLTRSLNLDVSQLIIDSFSWEEGPRLRMYLKLFPMFGASHSHSFNPSEVQQIRRKFTSWEFPPTDFFGPYELLNFTLLGPYSDVIFTNEGSSGINKGILAAIVLGAIACFFTISAVVFLLITRHRYQQAPSRRRSSLMISIKIDGVKTFTFKELATATQNFDSSTLVGRGGYGKVYKGILADETIVAIKRAEQGSLQGQKEFLTEIELLSRLHHRNLVSLIGYCDEEEEQMLVYEFMPNGTLRDWLSAEAKGILNFSTRLHVALGSAKGVLYLHTEAEPPIFHRDIKATNILLDSNLTAKVADFGLSRLAPNLDAEGNVPGYVSTVVKGTPGYLDPEYFLTHKLTDKSDVYSLGVVFLELLTCMHPISHGKNIVREVMTAHQSGMMFSVIDSRMGSYPSECLERFATLALSCCDDKTEKRPPMLAVVRELENILKMMPESDIIVSGSTSAFSVSSTTQSSSFVASSSLISSSLMGSDLVSGVIPAITPR